MVDASELRDTALVLFAGAGYTGTSIQRLADVVGVSKSAVLYHYASKETLLEAAISPAIDRMEEMLATLSSGPMTPASRVAFLEQFADFLLANRLQVHMFINQGPSLVDVPVIERANGVVRRLAEYFSSAVASIEEKMRFGIALGGAAYMLCSPQSHEFESGSTEETRAALVRIMTELLAPAHAAGSPSGRGTTALHGTASTPLARVTEIRRTPR